MYIAALYEGTLPDAGILDVLSWDVSRHKTAGAHQGDDFQPKKTTSLSLVGVFLEGSPPL